jgi:hypothetical protein
MHVNRPKSKQGLFNSPPVEKKNIQGQWRYFGSVLVTKNKHIFFFGLKELKVGTYTVIKWPISFSPTAENMDINNIRFLAWHTSSVAG